MYKFVPEHARFRLLAGSAYCDFCGVLLGRIHVGPDHLALVTLRQFI